MHATAHGGRTDQVRSDLASTILQQAFVVRDACGEARLTLRHFSPENTPMGVCFENSLALNNAPCTRRNGAMRVQGVLAECTSARQCVMKTADPREADTALTVTKDQWSAAVV